VIKRSLTTHFIKVCRYQTRRQRLESKGDASHGAAATNRHPKAASNGRIRGEARHMLGRCLDSLSPLTTAGGIGLLYKLTCTMQVKQVQ
jgi:hypothetical protein